MIAPREIWVIDDRRCSRATSHRSWPGSRDPRTELVCDFLLRWPTLDSLKRVRPSTLEQFFRAHHSARAEVNRERIVAIKQSVPLTTDPAVITASALRASALAAQMKATPAALKEFEAEIDALCQSHQDYPLFASLPGSGTVYSSRLLAAFGTDRGRFGSADEVARLAGIAPVVERSGKSTWVRWRYFCPKFLRQTFHEYAGRVGQALGLGAGLLRRPSVLRGSPIRRRSGPWLSSGSGSSGNAGRLRSPTMRRGTSKACGEGARRSCP